MKSLPKMSLPKMSLPKISLRKRKDSNVKCLWKTECQDSPPISQTEPTSRLVCVCFPAEDEKPQGKPDIVVCQEVQQSQPQLKVDPETVSISEGSEVSEVDWENDITSARREECAIAPLLEDQCVNKNITKYMSSHSMQLVREFANAISQKQVVDDVNCYVDELIEVFLNYVKENNYDPFVVNDIKDVNISCLTIYGLSSLCRTSNAKLYQEDCGTLVAELRGGFKKIRAVADVRRRICSGMTVKGQIRAKFENTEFYLKVRISAQNWMKPTLQRFSIYDWGNVKIYFQGTNFLGSMVHCTTRNLLPNVLAENAKRRLPPILKERVVEWFNKLNE